MNTCLASSAISSGGISLGGCSEETVVNAAAERRGIGFLLWRNVL
jgi:hypothetical protein